MRSRFQVHMMSLLGGLLLVAWPAQGCLEATPGAHEADAVSGPEAADDVAPAAPDTANGTADSGSPDSGEGLRELPSQGFIDFVIEAQGDRRLGASDGCYSFELRNGNDERVIARGAATGLDAAGEGGDGGPDWGEDGTDGAAHDWGAPEAWETSSPSRPLCATDHGFASYITYVLPCDATPGQAESTLRYWVNALCETGTAKGGDCVPYPGFVNPCGAEGCVVSVTCVADEDTEVRASY